MTPSVQWHPSAVVADACMRVGAPLRAAPPGLRSVTPGICLAGPTRPVRHGGSVDVFLEAIGAASPGDVLVIDNGGRLDEGCIGDLTAVEAQAAGLAGIIVWGMHRDTAEIRRLGVPLFSYGRNPIGPTRSHSKVEPPAARVTFGTAEVGADDVVFADDDGAIFVENVWMARVLKAAAEIAHTEAAQSARVLQGTSLREQLDFDRYIFERAKDASLTFRVHLRRLGHAMEE